MSEKQTTEEKIEKKAAKAPQKKQAAEKKTAPKAEAKKAPAKQPSSKKAKQDKIVILLPSYNPDEKLVNCVNELNAAGFDDIVVVDDGSKDECQKYFDEIKDKIMLVRHAVNQGKGRALKTGLNYAKMNYEGLVGVIAADGDGQHPIPAILDCRDAMMKNPDKLILGVRKFGKGKVPLANLMGNLITIGVFFGLTQIRFADTQCGLRGFPASVIDDMIATHGERFEYESNMLLDVRRKNIPFVEVPMDAVYIEDNKTSHFNKVTDSINIYSNILKFGLFPAFAGVLAYVLSYLVFMNLGCMALIKIPSAYASGILFGWFLLSFTFKNERFTDFLLIFFTSIVSTGIFYGLYLWLHKFTGAWWLAAIVIAPLSYGIYLRVRYGKSPKKEKYVPARRKNNAV